MSFSGIFYDKLYRSKPYAQEVDRMLPYLQGRTILDVGGGTGGHSAILKKKGFEPHILDISESMLAVAAKKGLSVEVGDIATYRSPEKYDAVIAMFHVLNFCADLKPVLANIHDALKENGVFIFDVWDPSVKKEGSELRYDGLMTRYSRKKWEKNEVFIEFFFPLFMRTERNHLYCPTGDELEHSLSNAGFVIERWEGDGLNFFCVARRA